MKTSFKRNGLRLNYVDSVYYRSSLNKLGKVDGIIQKEGEFESQWKDINTTKQFFPSLRVFSNESALPSRWPKYESFTFSISSPSNEHSENEDHGIWSHHFMGNRWGNSGNSVRL